MENKVTLRFLAEPGDVNFGGKVHGGAVMNWIDLAAYACASAWSACYCVTVYAGGIRFLEPIHVGDLVEVRAKVIYTGTSSMHIVIDVKASEPTKSEKRLTTHCIVIMVAVDKDGSTTKVPEWIPQSAADKKLHQSAIRLMALRKQIGSEMDAHIEENS